MGWMKIIIENWKIEEKFVEWFEVERKLMLEKWDLRRQKSIT